MYKILIVDDEPLICKGLQSLLADVGLKINDIFIAYSGYEAMDYIKLETIDLLITDIQMENMNGIELMQQANMLCPNLKTIVISAYEDFQYAQQAIRLGAKDYLIKPLNSRHLVDMVRDILLSIENTPTNEVEYLSTLKNGFSLKEEHIKKEYLNSVLSGELPLKPGDQLTGPYFAILHFEVSLDELSLSDQGLLRYAVKNIATETLSTNSCSTVPLVYETSSYKWRAILQWNHDDYAEFGMNKIGVLEMMGRALHMNIERFLSLKCKVGISQTLKGASFLPELNQQAEKAMTWIRENNDSDVLYYGDLRSMLDIEGFTEDMVQEQMNRIVQKVKADVEKHYHEKGLTLQEIAVRNHVSPNYLSHLFKKAFGYNLWEYVIELRMKESRRLVMTTDLRRYEIAEMVGYESPEHFSKVFKRYFGVSMSEMKNR